MSTVSLKSDRPSALAEFWYYFSRNKGAVIGLAVFVFVLFLAIFAGVVAPHDPDAAYGSAMQRLPPVWAEGSNSSFLLGTDANGRDLLSRLIYGTRFSLFIGLVVASLSALAGILIGLVAGYVRGRTDTIIMRIMDIILAIPVAAFGSRVGGDPGAGPDERHDRDLDRQPAAFRPPDTRLGDGRA